VKRRDVMIKTLIFDFDGLILDSETVVYQSWVEIYEEFNCTLPLEKWILRVGGSITNFDAHSYLETLCNRSLSRKDLDEKRIKRQWELLENYEALPGVTSYLTQAKLLGLKVGLASSSERDWVESHLKRLGLDMYFDCIKCGGDVCSVKPHPELYLSVLTELDTFAEHAIAFEDSPNGIRAAQSAGIFCVVVPNAITSLFLLDHADLRLTSLADIPIEDLVTIVEVYKARGETFSLSPMNR
jgi:HAD superfamily hydrolase (TIGR01509 family)